MGFGGQEGGGVNLSFFVLLLIDILLPAFLLHIATLDPTNFKMS